MDEPVRDCGDFGELPETAVLTVRPQPVTFIRTTFIPLRPSSITSSSWHALIEFGKHPSNFLHIFLILFTESIDHQFLFSAYAQ